MGGLGGGAVLNWLHELQQSCGLLVNEVSLAWPVWYQPAAPVVVFWTCE